MNDPRGASAAAGPKPALVAAAFAAHAGLRIGGMWLPALVPLSMAIVWPLPWLLLRRDGRQRIGIRRPARGGWIGAAGLAGFAALAACAAAAWLAFGSGSSNWLVQHRDMLLAVRLGMPSDWSASDTFWMLTIPAMIFSPLGEELLYRGLLQRTVADRFGVRAGLLVPSAAFALVHLTHYGLDPLDPALIALWVPSIFVVGLVLGWLAERYGSLAPPILAHATFNLAMNWVALRLLPAVAGG